MDLSFPLRPRIHETAFTSLPGLLKQQADLRPDSPAVTLGDRTLTFAGLEQGGSRLASHLLAQGVSADDRVGLYVEPSFDLMVGAWGILFAGAAYLPLSPDYPEDRLRYMIEDSRTEVIVTQPHLVARLRDLAPKATRVVTLADADHTPYLRPAPPRSDALAYVIYTSGSTGRPKGVMIENRSIVSQIRWMHSCGHLGTGTTVLQKTPMSFDAAQWEILAPAVGSRVTIAARGSFRDPEALIDTVITERVTTLQGVPTLLQAMVDTERLSMCTTLRRVFSGGEALTRRLARTLIDELPWVSLVNLYGPTECTINATACLVDPDEIDKGAGTVPIGVPVDNTQCFVLDENGAPADIGEVGELYIGGTQLARGYLHRPDLTEERFVPSPFVPTERLYRTGDLAYWNPDGTLQFAGRTDNQVKLRGYRIELEEVAASVEAHPWVKRAAVVVADDERTGSPSLIACVELNPKEAAVMDQGNHGAHHQSKASRLQVRAQLSNPGLRSREQLDGLSRIDLPGRAETEHQRRGVFARKTYRFFEGAETTREDLLKLLAPRSAGDRTRSLESLTLAELGEILRWFGQFHSEERLLPKHAYASPGALYATQMCLETSGVAGIEHGVYYYHPADHALVRTGHSQGGTGAFLNVHFIGRRQAIEPVYRNNIDEVLEFEAGHMVGVFEEVLPGYGLDIAPLGREESSMDRLGAAPDDHCLGAFAIVPDDDRRPADPTEVFVQAHPGGVADLPEGHYRYRGGELERFSDDVVQRRHVIAINQKVYERAAFGITAVSRADQEWLRYISLGTKLHHLQRNGLGLGFMSSGYSSKSGRPLPAARRIDDILAASGIASGASYFFLGGGVSDEQIRSEGMREDSVHMQGPSEMIKDELANVLPDYMIPSRVLVLDELPRTANGKIDCKALAASEAVRSADAGAPYVAPATETERWLATAWGEALHYEDVSAADEFFASGGNSLTAVALVNRINREFGTALPLQVVFERPILADLAAKIEGGVSGPSTRLVRLAAAEGRDPVFCWPGLGGYPMGLRLLGVTAGLDRSFYGIQAHGLNEGEAPYATIREMAAADVAEIRRLQPRGPYALWGYSFGARVSFEAAWQLEQLGETVEQLMLICPGNPKVPGAGGDTHGRSASFDNPTYTAILLSVFTGAVTGPELDRCLDRVRDEDGFAAFVHGLIPTLDEPLIRRIAQVVAQTYEFEYRFTELAQRRLKAPITVFKAAGDDYAFIESSSGYSAAAPTVIDLDSDHYGVLRERGVAELAAAIRARLN